MPLNNLIVRFQWCYGEAPFIGIAPRSTQARNGSTWLGPIYGLNKTNLHTYAKLNCLNKNCLTKLSSLKNMFFIVQVQFLLAFKLRTYAKQNCLKQNCFWHWNCTHTKLNCLTLNCFEIQLCVKNLYLY